MINQENENLPFPVRFYLIVCLSKAQHDKPRKRELAIFCHVLSDSLTLNSIQPHDKQMKPQVPNATAETRISKINTSSGKGHNKASRQTAKSGF